MDVGVASSSINQINGVEKVCLCKKKVVGGISCDSCNNKYHSLYTNTNKEIRKWICKSCAQATRSKSDVCQIGCEVCNTVADELEECKKDKNNKNFFQRTNTSGRGNEYIGS
jgi:hypothetical protein